jgi:ribonuclease P protein component
MLAKKYKLTRKDVNFIFKKQKVVPGKYFSFFVWPQRPNRAYNQFGFLPPVKLTKKATLRNFIKRIVFDYIRNDQIYLKPLDGKYWKIFIIFNKKTISNLAPKLSNISKKELKTLIQDWFRQSFKDFDKKVKKFN